MASGTRLKYRFESVCFVEMHPCTHLYLLPQSTPPQYANSYFCAMPQSANAEICVAFGDNGKPLIKLRPIHPTVDRGSTVTRRFGAHRFLRVRVPFDGIGVDGDANSISKDDTKKLLASFLANEPRFKLGGRQWSFLAGKPLDSQLIFFAVRKAPGEMDFDELTMPKQVQMPATKGGLGSTCQSRVMTVCDQLRHQIVPENETNLAMPHYKFASRHALGFSSTKPTVLVELERVKIIDDDEHDGGRATDGAGMISFAFAKRVQEALELNHMPSAFQARVLAFGAKGVWSICHPWPEAFTGYDMVMRKSMIKFKGYAQVWRSCMQSYCDARLYGCQCAPNGKNCRTVIESMSSHRPELCLKQFPFLFVALLKLIYVLPLHFLTIATRGVCYIDGHRGCLRVSSVGGLEA